MAIFNKADQQATQSRQSNETSVIAGGAKIEGTVNIESKLHIDGEINGQVFSTNHITIGKNGRFKGEMKAYKLMISGVFEGSVEADSVEILEGGKLFGKVLARDLVIESRAVFEGESKIKRDSKSEPETITVEPEKQIDMKS
jgi:cytoskeletal protein CcmA (bactofilin family)